MAIGGALGFWYRTVKKFPSKIESFFLCIGSRVFTFRTYVWRGNRESRLYSVRLCVYFDLCCVSDNKRY